MRVQPLIVWFKSSLQCYALCIFVVLLLRLLWPPVDGKERAAIENKYLYRVYGGPLYIWAKLYAVTVREEEAAIISSFQAIDWRAAVQVDPGLYMSG